MTFETRLSFAFCQDIEAIKKPIWLYSLTYEMYADFHLLVWSMLNSTNKNNGVNIMKLSHLLLLSGLMIVFHSQAMGSGYYDDEDFEDGFSPSKIVLSRKISPSCKITPNVYSKKPLERTRIVTQRRNKSFLMQKKKFR